MKDSVGPFLSPSSSDGASAAPFFFPPTREMRPPPTLSQDPRVPPFCSVTLLVQREGENSYYSLRIPRGGWFCFFFRQEFSPVICRHTISSFPDILLMEVQGLPVSPFFSPIGRSLFPFFEGGSLSFPKESFSASSIAESIRLLLPRSEKRPPFFSDIVSAVTPQTPTKTPQL